jgi:hypothetical protein
MHGFSDVRLFPVEGRPCKVRSFVYSTCPVGSMATLYNGKHPDVGGASDYCRVPVESSAAIQVQAPSA